MFLFFKLFSFLPMWLAHGMGAALGWVVFALSPTYRRRFLDNTQQAGYRFGEIVGAVAQTGRMVAEIPKLWTSDQGKPQSQKQSGQQVPFVWDQASTITCIEAAYQKGKGVIFLTPHMGCFEIVAQALALQFSAPYGPLTVLYRPARKAWMAQLVANSRDRPGLIAVPTNLFGVRQMIKALRKGQAVGLLPDQVPPNGMGLWSSFFGKEAYTMTLAARLAAQTGATVLVGWGRRLPWGRGYEIHFHEINQGLDGDLATAVQLINADMESLIRACPEQYLWGYGRYKQPRVESKEAVKDDVS